MTRDEVSALVSGEFPDGKVTVSDMTGTGDHYKIHVIDRRFEGMSLVERHRLMHGILDEPMKGDVHAVMFKTQTPEEVEGKK